MNTGLLWTIATYVCSVFVIIGVYKYKIDSIQDRVKTLENENKNNNIKLTSIQVQLADIQAKLGMLLSGKVLKD